MKKRAKHLFFVVFVLGVILTAYYYFYRTFPQYALRCVFFEIVGFKCPGCGITRMLACFLDFNFIEGIKNNAFLGFSLPLVFVMICYSFYLYINDKKSNKWFDFFCYIYIFLLLVWAIVRNIVGI